MEGLSLQAAPKHALERMQFAISHLDFLIG